MSEPGDGTDRPNNRTTAASTGTTRTNPGVRADWRGLRFEDEVNATKSRRFGLFIARSINGILVGLGLKRRRNAQGELEPRDWKRIFTVFGTALLVILIWTSVHIVPPGNVAVPVTLGNPGNEIGPGIHLTLPFTTTKNMSFRTQQYTMSKIKGDGNKANIDDSVLVLGRDGGSASIDATVLWKMDRARATRIYDDIGRSIVPVLIRPSARSCIRSEFTNYNMVDAATSDWHRVEDRVAKCMSSKIEPRGLELLDFQLREVTLGTQIQKTIDAKVASQQRVKQLEYDYAAAKRQADIAAVAGQGIFNGQQIAQCGYEPSTVGTDGSTTETLVPKTSDCHGLTPDQYLQFQYIQALQNLVTSNNATTIIMPFDQNLTPLIQVPSGGTSSSGGSSTTPTTTNRNASTPTTTGR